MYKFYWNDDMTPTYLNFQHMFGWELIDNSLMQTELEMQQDEKRKLRNAHKLLPEPKHANGWDGRDWLKNAKSQYQQ